MAVATGMADIPLGKLLSRDLTPQPCRYFIASGTQTKRFHVGSFGDHMQSVVKLWIKMLPKTYNTVRFECVDGIWHCLAGCSYDLFCVAESVAISAGVEEIYDADTSTDRKV